MKKTKRISLGLLIVLSVFVSSLAACACLRHAALSEAPSCHGHPAAPPANGSAERLERVVSGSECGCVQPAPRVIAETEKIKIEKKASALPVARLEPRAVSAVGRAGSGYFEKPFYLSGVFRNPKSPRAPPAA